jgi:hypothetical protein
MHSPFIFIVLVFLIFFIIFLFYPNIIKLIPVFSKLEIYQIQLSKLYFRSELLDEETTVLSLCNTLPKRKDFYDVTKNPNIENVLNDYNHINYGQIFYIVSQWNKRINYIKYELKVYSFILVFLSIAFLLFQLGNNVQTFDITILIIQCVVFAFFSVRLLLEISNVQLNVDKIILTKHIETIDTWKKAETIGKIGGAIAAIIGLILFFIKAATI